MKLENVAPYTCVHFKPLHEYVILLYFLRTVPQDVGLLEQVMLVHLHLELPLGNATETAEIPKFPL